MGRDPLAAARFPDLAADAGHYESYYVKLADPERPRGAWIRYTVLRRPGEQLHGSLWCVVWTGDRPPVADKLTVVGAERPAGALVAIAGATLSAAGAAGSAGSAAWSLSLRALSEPFPYLPAAALYRWPLPRTKAVSLIPHARASGTVRIGGAELAVDGWPAMLGHNWGSEHAERWIWLHASAFADAPDAWFDATVGRIGVGRLVLPWVAGAGLWLDGRLHRLGGPRRAAIAATRSRCAFTLSGRAVSVTGEVRPPAGQSVAWRYSDPGGGEHVTVNCSVAPMELTVRRPGLPARRLRLAAGAAYELGTREAPAGIAVQPFPDP